MIPLRDDIPSLRPPIVNYTLIGVCVVVYLMQVAAPDGGEEIIARYGMIPLRVTSNDTGPLAAVVPKPVLQRNGEIAVVQEQRVLPPLPIPAWLTMFTCLFLHGSLMHIVGNMWFLVIFGDNVEDRYGHFAYLLMYLLGGLAAGLLQLLSSPSSPLPTVGASGAIAGVMGAYFLLYPHARVLTLIPLMFLWPTVVLPAPLFLGIWFLFQIASALFQEAGLGGVAWWAHVGGFLTGLGLTLWGKRSGWLAPPPRYGPMPFA